MVRLRLREDADFGRCVQALADVHEAGAYPTNWPADPVRWLTPSGLLRAWIAATDERPVAGHVLLRQAPGGEPGQPAEVSRLFVVPAARRQGIGQALLQQAMRWAAAHQLDLVLEVTGHLRAARTLYEQAGFSLLGTGRATWTSPRGEPVTLHRFAWHRDPGPQGRRRYEAAPGGRRGPGPGCRREAPGVD